MLSETKAPRQRSALIVVETSRRPGDLQTHAADLLLPVGMRQTLVFSPPAHEKGTEWLGSVLLFSASFPGSCRGWLLPFVTKIMTIMMTVNYLRIPVSKSYREA